MKPAPGHTTTAGRQYRISGHIGSYLLILILLSLIPYWLLIRMVSFSVFPTIIISIGYAVVWIGLYTVYRQQAVRPARSPHTPETDPDFSGLNATYRVFRNLKLPEGGKADAVIIGPTGVWTMIMQRTGGIFSYDQSTDRLLVNGRQTAKDILKDALQLAVSMKHYLQKEAGVETVIQPVLVCTSAHVSLDFGYYPVNGVYIIPSRQIRQLVTEYGRDELAEQERMKAVDALRAL